MSARCLLLLLLANPTFAAGPPVGRWDIHFDPLPAGAVARLGTVRWRHFRASNNPTISPDGRWLASANLDEHSPSGGLFLWEATTGRLHQTLGRPGLLFHRFTFLHDSKSIVSCDFLGEYLYHQDVLSGRLLRRWPGPGKEVIALAVRPDGRLLAVGEKEGRVQLHDLRGRKRPWSLPGNKKLRALAFSAGGCLAILREKGIKGHFIVQQIDLLTRRQLHSFEIGPVDADNSELAPDGRHVATFSRRFGVCLWRVDTGTCRPVRFLPHDGHYQFRFSPDGRTLLAKRFTVRYSSDGQLIDGESSNDVWFCDVDCARFYHRVPAVSFNFAPLLFPDGRVMAGGDYNQQLLLQDVRSGKRLQQRAGFNSPVELLAFSTDGQSIAADPYWEGLTWWRTSDGTCLSPTQVELQFSPDNRATDPPVFAPGGGQIAFCKGSEVLLQDSRTGKLIRALRGHESNMGCVAFAPDGRRLASADKKGIVRLWDLPSGRLHKRIDASKKVKEVAGLLFSPDGRRLVTVESSWKLHLWDVGTGKRICSLRKEVDEDEELLEGQVNGESVAFSQDGNWLFTDLLNGFRVWDLHRSEEPSEVRIDPGRFPPRPQAFPQGGLRLSADGRFLLRIDISSGVLLYETASRQVLHHFPCSCGSVKFAPVGWKLATADDWNLCILIWDLGALFRSMPPTRPGKQSLASLWTELKHQDAGLAHRSLWRLATLEGMEDFLGQRLQVVTALPAGRLKHHLRNLESEDFTTRQKAEQALTAGGEAVLPALEVAHAKARDLELRARLNRLLRRFNPQDAAWLRQQRAILALEVRATLGARRLLQRLAAGMPEARLTREANSALLRLAGRKQR